MQLKQDEEYKQIQESLNLLKILAMNDKDFEEGKFEPLDKAFADLREKLKHYG